MEAAAELGRAEPDDLEGRRFNEESSSGRAQAKCVCVVSGGSRNKLEKVQSSLLPFVLKSLVEARTQITQTLERPDCMIGGIKLSSDRD